MLQENAAEFLCVLCSSVLNVLICGRRSYAAGLLFSCFLAFRARFSSQMAA
jgi:hypothetical protein